MNEDICGKVLRIEQDDVEGEGVRRRFDIRPASAWFLIGYWYE